MAAIIACAAGLLNAGVAAGQTPGPNLLKNPTFSPPSAKHIDVCGGGQTLNEVETPDGWMPYWKCRPSDQQNDFINRTPEFRPAGLDLPGRVRSAPTALKYFTFWALNQNAGVYQVVRDVPAGTRLRFKLWVQLWSTNTDEPNSKTQPGGLQARVCIDQLGRAGPPSFDAETVCSGWSRRYDEYFEMSVEGVTKNGYVTVILNTSADYPVKHNDVYADDAELVAIGTGPTAPAPAPGQPAPVPAPGQPAPAPAPAPAPEPDMAYVNVESANLRDGPSTTANVVAQAAQGLALTIRGKSADGQWYRVAHSQIPGGVAWVNQAVVRLGSAPPAPAPSAPAPQPAAAPPAPAVSAPAPAPPATSPAMTSAKPMVVANTQGKRLNMRINPRPTSGIYGQSRDGTAFEVRGVSADKGYWRVLYSASPTSMSWVLADVVTPNSVAQQLLAGDRPQVTVANRLVALRTTTRLSSAAIRNVAAGEVLDVVGKSANDLWWKVNVPGTAGGTAWLYALYGIANAAADAAPVAK